jgi:hypothetical protein
MKVRAGAGAASFRRRGRLEEARQRVEALKAGAEESGDEPTRQRAGARQRAARERQQRLEDALQQCAELQQQREEAARKSGREVEEARASTTDPDARNMKFAHGGYHPGYNVQFATDTRSGVIVGVEVTNVGTDSDELVPMLEQLDRRYDRVPPEALVDGGFATLEAIERADDRGCTVYAPLKNEEKQRRAGKDPYVAKKGDSAAVARWRERMGTAAAQAMYRLRGQTAEWVNARCRNRGMRSLPVRGRARCRLVGLLYAIAHNLVVGGRLRAEAAVSGT